MRDGISAVPVDESLPYAALNNELAIENEFFPCLSYAIFWQESIQGQVNGKWDAATVISSDGGHGIGQLTSSWPDDWPDPKANIRYALSQFLLPAYNYWKPQLQGDDLVRAIAASYNAGIGGAVKGHAEGNVDKYTTDNYGARALAKYKELVSSQ